MHMYTVMHNKLLVEKVVSLSVTISSVAINFLLLQWVSNHHVTSRKAKPWKHPSLHRFRLHPICELLVVVRLHGHIIIIIYNSVFKIGYCALAVHQQQLLHSLDQSIPRRNHCRSYPVTANVQKLQLRLLPLLPLFLPWNGSYTSTSVLNTIEYCLL